MEKNDVVNSKYEFTVHMVGHWIFEPRQFELSEENKLNKGYMLNEELLKLLEKVLLELYNSELLFAEWMQIELYDIAEKEFSQSRESTVYKRSVRFTNTVPEKQVAEIKNFLTERIVKERLYAFDILSLQGYGLVYTKDGKQKVRDLVSIDGFRFSEPYFGIASHSDVWVPLSINGNWQIETYSLNKDRLSNTLEKINELDEVITEIPLIENREKTIQSNFMIYNLPELIRGQEPDSEFDVAAYLKSVVM